MPSLDKQSICAIIPYLNVLPEQYGFITALCAFVVLQSDVVESCFKPKTLGSGPKLDAVPSAELLVEETCRARQFSNHIEDPSLTTVHTSFFLFATFFALGKDNSAWFHIRESLTMLQL